MLTVNSKIPSFKVVNQYNQTITEQDLAGKITVLYFYPKDNTPGCTCQAKSFSNLLPEFVKHNATIIGISKDTPEKHQKFIEKYHLQFDLLSDPTLEMHKQFGVYGPKKMFGVNTMGTTRSTFIISPTLECLYAQYKVSALKNPQEMLDIVANYNK